MRGLLAKNVSQAIRFASQELQFIFHCTRSSFLLSQTTDSLEGLYSSTDLVHSSADDGNISRHSKWNCGQLHFMFKSLLDSTPHIRKNEDHFTIPPTSPRYIFPDSHNNKSHICRNLIGLSNNPCSWRTWKDSLLCCGGGWARSGTFVVLGEWMK